MLLNLDGKNKKYLVYEVLLISLMILSKQVLGLLVIPCLIYSKNKKKSFLIYLGIGLIFILTLILNNSLLDFINYCFLGMFDFSSKNNVGFNFLLVIEILIIGYLIYEFIKKKDKNVLYILCFQIMSFPIVNYPHFIISFIPVVYYIFKYKNKYVNLLASSYVVVYFIIFSIGVMISNKTYMYVSNSNYDNFYKGRMVSNHLGGAVLDIGKIIDKYDKDRYYILGNLSYIVKLTYNYEINKFDLINNGNMGLDGEEVYIEEIDDYCSFNKCLFILENRGEDSTNQTSVEILRYVEDNYMLEMGGNMYKVYVN